MKQSIRTMRVDKKKPAKKGKARKESPKRSHSKKDNDPKKTMTKKADKNRSKMADLLDRMSSRIKASFNKSSFKQSFGFGHKYIYLTLLVILMILLLGGVLYLGLAKISAYLMQFQDIQTKVQQGVISEDFQALEEVGSGNFQALKIVSYMIPLVIILLYNLFHYFFWSILFEEKLNFKKGLEMIFGSVGFAVIAFALMLFFISAMKQAFMIAFVLITLLLTYLASATFQVYRVRGDSLKGSLSASLNIFRPKKSARYLLILLNGTIVLFVVGILINIAGALLSPKLLMPFVMVIMLLYLIWVRVYTGVAALNMDEKEKKMRKR